MKIYAIYGGGGFGQDILPEVQAFVESKVEPDSQLIVIDDVLGVPSLNGIPVLTFEETLRRFPANAYDLYVSISVSNSRDRADLAQKVRQSGYSFWSLISDLAIVGTHVQIGDGPIFVHYTTIGSNVVIGDHFHSGLLSYVAHNCVIGDYVTFGPRVSCNGYVHIHDFAYVGTGAIIRNGSYDNPLIIGEGAVVGMGAVVTKSVPPGVVVVGNPARPMQKYS